MTGVQTCALPIYLITQVFEGAWHIPTWLGSLIVVGLMVLISAGGVKRFATFSDWAVPFAAGIYCLTAVVVLVANAAVIPSMIQLMFASAFGSDAALGGLLGTAVAWGVKRGVYSNEAGEGTAAHAALVAAAGAMQNKGKFFLTEHNLNIRDSINKLLSRDLNRQGVSREGLGHHHVFGDGHFGATGLHLLDDLLGVAHQVRLIEDRKSVV